MSLAAEVEEKCWLIFSPLKWCFKQCEKPDYIRCDDIVVTRDSQSTHRCSNAPLSLGSTKEPSRRTLGAGRLFGLRPRCQKLLFCSR